MGKRPKKKIVIVGNVLEWAKKNFQEKLSPGSLNTAKNVQILARVVERAFSNFKRPLLGSYGADLGQILH
jgi:hypothetical protein